MRRETQNVLLVLLGATILKLVITGDYLRYVKPTHLAWLIGGAVVVAGLGAIAIWRDIRRNMAATRDRNQEVPQPDGVAEPACGSDDGGGHSHSTPVSWMLLAPVLAVFLIAPPALGADSVQRSGERSVSSDSSRAASAEFEPLPDEEVVALPVVDFVRRAAWDDSGSLDGRTVALTGFVVHQEGEVQLARMVIACCAADATPVTVRLGGRAGPQVRQFDEDEWIRVTGTLVPGSATEHNNFTPELDTRQVDGVPEPRQPYER
ncbi:TIGR03943 family putative permease subunit [Haloechinothrix sp. LS1_15]|uniref:TIGR03943 family putative permease subunit n=1 Tax=Haloechinothrix sp. LS1_15 TaxID=2652248 RepID=UPI002944FF88|nr:TIGR03943 family protein [Haloechinothrix sp. LS1_15]MDV6013800.1 TIGR03943 family protein [Haloechinothrix sp. LS1_15]